MGSSNSFHALRWWRTHTRFRWPPEWKLIQQKEMAISARVNSDPIRFKDPPPPEKKIQNFFCVPPFVSVVRYAIKDLSWHFSPWWSMLVDSSGCAFFFFAEIKRRRQQTSLFWSIRREIKRFIARATPSSLIAVPSHATDFGGGRECAVIVSQSIGFGAEMFRRAEDARALYFFIARKSSPSSSSFDIVPFSLIHRNRQSIDFFFF